MAKITSIVTFVNKIGNIVGMKGKDGEYYLRQHQPRPHNPRSSRQMKNRVSIANLSTFWRSMYGKDRPSFEIKNAKESDFNAFFRVNRAATKIFLTKQEVARGCSVVSDYTITVGSLQPVVYEVLVSGMITTDIVLGDEFTMGPTISVAEFSKAIMDNNPDRFQMYDQLTFVYFEQKTDSMDSPYIETKFFKMVLDQEDRSKVFSHIPQAYNPCVTSDGHNYVGCSIAIQGGFGLIVSREVSGQTKVSTTKIMVNNSIMSLYTTYEAREKAIASYGKGSDNFLTPVVEEEDPNMNP